MLNADCHTCSTSSNPAFIIPGVIPLSNFQAPVFPRTVPSADERAPLYKKRRRESLCRLTPCMIALFSPLSPHSLSHVVVYCAKEEPTAELSYRFLFQGGLVRTYVQYTRTTYIALYYHHHHKRRLKTLLLLLLLSAVVPPVGRGCLSFSFSPPCSREQVGRHLVFVQWSAGLARPQVQLGFC